MSHKLKVELFKKRILLGERKSSCKKHLEHSYAKHANDQPSCPPNFNINSKELENPNTVVAAEDRINVNLTSDQDLGLDLTIGDLHDDDNGFENSQMTTQPLAKGKKNASKNICSSFSQDLLNEDFSLALKITLSSLKELSKLPGPVKLQNLFLFASDVEPCDWDHGHKIFNEMNVHKGSLEENLRKFTSMPITIASAVAYMHSICEQIKPNLSLCEKQYCGAEFLRRFAEKLRVTIGKKCVRNEITQTPHLEAIPFTNQKMTKEEEILYYVSGSTINSVNKKIPADTDFLSVVCFKGGAAAATKLSQKIAAIAQWTRKMDRGGLIFVNEHTFEIFCEINTLVDTVYISRLTELVNNVNKKDAAKQLILNSQSVKQKWKNLLLPLEFQNKEKILDYLIDSFLNLRGKALAIYYKTKYQIANRAQLKCKLSLRKDLKKDKLKK